MLCERIDATVRSALLRVGAESLPPGADPVLVVGEATRIGQMVGPTHRAGARVFAYAVPVELLEGEPALALETSSGRIELPAPRRRALRGVDAVRAVDDHVRTLEFRVAQLTERLRQQATEQRATAADAAEQEEAAEPGPGAGVDEGDRLAAAEARAEVLSRELEVVRDEAVATAERLQHELAEATEAAQRTATDLDGVAEELARARAKLEEQAAQPVEPAGVPVAEVEEMQRRLAELGELRLQAEERARTTAAALTLLLHRAHQADVLEREMAELRSEFTELGELLVETREAVERERAARAEAEAVAAEAQAERDAAVSAQEALRADAATADAAAADARTEANRIKVELEEMWQRAAEDAAVLASARGVEATLERELDAATVELAAVRTQAEQLAAALEEQERRLETSERDVADRDAELEQAGGRLQGLATALAELRASHDREMAKVVAELDRVVAERDAAQATVLERDRAAEDARLAAEAELAAVQAVADGHAAEAALLRERLEAVQAEAQRSADTHARAREALQRLHDEALRRRERAGIFEQHVSGLREMLAERSAAAYESRQVQLLAAERGAAAAERVGRRVADVRLRLLALAAEPAVRDTAPESSPDRELAHH